MANPPLVDSYLAFCEYKKSSKKSTIDLSEAAWFYPTTLLPLFNLLQSKNGALKYSSPKARNVRDYLSFITDEKNQGVADTAIPIIRAKRLDDSYVDKIYALIVRQQREERIKTAISYVIGEIVANIDGHSQCNNSIFMAQNYPKWKFCEVGFFDNGITIPGSFREAGILEKGITDSECIKRAITGTSTKPEGGRGHGLPSIIKILKDMNSDILIVSGKGAAYLSGSDKYVNGQVLYELEDYMALDGTLIAFQMYSPIKIIDIYKEGYL